MFGKKFAKGVVVCTLGFGVGCATNVGDSGEAESATVAAGSERLGIASFSVQDTATMTTVVGADANGAELWRLELTHGTFALSPAFREDYPGRSVVDGRRVKVTKAGAQRLLYEAGDYEPVMNMPAHPPEESDLAAFLEDPHVKPVLDHWQIGWLPSDTVQDRAYSNGAHYGSSVTDCSVYSSSRVSCGSVQSRVINTCSGGTVSAMNAYRVDQSSQYLVSQCCPPVSGTSDTSWYAYKACPTSGSSSSCGTVASGAACRGCATYSAKYACEQWPSGGGSLTYSYFDDGGIGNYYVNGYGPYSHQAWYGGDYVDNGGNGGNFNLSVWFTIQSAWNSHGGCSVSSSTSLYCYLDPNSYTGSAGVTFQGNGSEPIYFEAGL